MWLSELKKKQKGKIINIYSSEELKQRFYSFGVVVGAVVQIEHINFDKNTIQILVEDTDIAIRIEEAKVIEVIKVEE